MVDICMFTIGLHKSWFCVSCFVTINFNSTMLVHNLEAMHKLNWLKPALMQWTQKKHMSLHKTFLFFPLISMQETLALLLLLHVCASKRIKRSNQWMAGYKFTFCYCFRANALYVYICTYHIRLKQSNIVLGDLRFIYNITQGIQSDITKP